MTAYNKTLVEAYIQQVWNKGQLEQLDQFIHDAYRDHSLPAGIPQNREGLQSWISQTSLAFAHETIIESIVAEGDMVVVRILFRVRQIGKWRNIEPAFGTAETKGFRQFQIRDGKIAAHWALLDGEALQAALTRIPHGCTIPEPSANP